MSRFRFSVAAAVVLFAGTACGDDARAPELSVTGDSVVTMKPVSLDNEVVGVNCVSSFVATLTGASTDSATIRSGRIAYVWETGQPLTEYEWTEQTLPNVWSDLTLRGGETHRSLEHGVGQSAPGQPLRATVVFRYTRGEDDEIHETEPYTFVCRNP